MAGMDEKLKAVLQGYANFLREKKLALLKHRSHLVRWVREFVVFAEKHRDCTFEPNLGLVPERTGGTSRCQGVAN
ncbi:hypothetical protein SAMN02745206_01693 [Desulfacinum infernum DSM 9756]|uniref:Uncharacterized protein n=1 Tax=Desulfacinum infernum DSM 9756 TaxID=1121391 RepID=A0A1M5AFD0_9BACT|nr:hypothetical protein SAMN02745206_01693 [Desulfacinum infernum DSM 9756]